MGLRAGLDWCGKSRRTGIRSPDRSARRQSLYGLSYPAPVFYVYSVKFTILFRPLDILIVILPIASRVSALINGCGPLLRRDGHPRSLTLFNNKRDRAWLRNLRNVNQLPCLSVKLSHIAVYPIHPDFLFTSQHCCQQVSIWEQRQLYHFSLSLSVPKIFVLRFLLSSAGTFTDQCKFLFPPPEYFFPNLFYVLLRFGT